MGVAGNQAYWEGQPEGVTLLDTTIGDMFDASVLAEGDREAVVYDYPELNLELRLSYRQLHEVVQQLAKGVMALGVQAGDKVAVLAPNLPQWLFLEVALAKIGAVLVTVNTGYKQAELAYLLKNGDIKVLFTVESYRNNSFLEALYGIVPELGQCLDPVAQPLQSAALPHLRQVVILGEVDKPGCLRYQRVLELGADVTDAQLAQRQATVQPHDVAQIQYTSGTTGHPKGVMLSHHSTLNNAMLTSLRLPFGEAERFLCSMPLFHTAGCVVNVLSTLLNRGTLIMAVWFDARKMLELIHAERPTIINMVPTMLIAMLNDEGFQQGRYDTRSIKKMLTGGTSIPIVLIEEVARKIGGNPTIVLGLTETSPIVCETLADDSFERKSSTVGKPLPHTSVRIVDTETGRVAGFGEAGEIQVKGYLLMKGYYKMPDKTAMAMDADGWFRTGDLGSMDAEGYVRVIGRVKDMIIRGGENIYPVEIEEFLLRHEHVEEAAVVGVPDDYMGEEAVALVRRAVDSNLDEDALRTYCREGISRYKVPKYYLFVESFPLTPSGKFKKNELRRIAAEQLGLIIPE
ncbi:AMP-binding protein [Pusillimonas sp. CC-YST705]|uniref:AMP-binding protein n=1 Tax=Mesopusillimonas faecipullorum TaxID=2755040 RepID=A0ABS8C956_9BURK|nr:AMP-binding protein [Mesopusillimonas faecipullorum]MCB5362548.1 AMP-binding protein [Mesopusillimonas faecipullorum]